MTKLMYLDDTYLSETSATVVGTGCDDRGTFLVFDNTIFYPQGGGQPADKGVISIDETPIPVSFVGFVEGNVRHYVLSPRPSEFVGKSAELKVDGCARLTNARLHTAGHLISHAVEAICERLSPIKGYHFPDGAYVEFSNSGDVDFDTLVADVNVVVAEDIRNRVSVKGSYSDFDEISELRPYLAAFVPRDKPSRIVTIGGYRPLPCGGTHICDLSQLGSLSVTKAKRSKANVRISYRLDCAGTTYQSR